MGDTSGIPCLSNTTVLEVASKIIISAVILLFIVIAKVFLLHIYTRLFWSSSYEARYILSWRRQQATITHQQQQQRGPGLDQSILNSLPIVSYSGDDINLKEVGGLECCAICLCELQKVEKVRFLPKCNRGFHLDCIDIWFKSHSSCPVCRADLVIVEGGSDTDSAVLTPPISSGDNGEDHHDHGRGVGNIY